MIANRARPRTRAPAAAGSFYPRSEKTLRQTVESLLSAVPVQQRSQSRGIIAPHAGYAYSGQVAAAAFACVRCCSWINRAVVIGPAHFVPFRGIAAPSDSAFATPLGDMPVDVAAVEALSEEMLVTIDDAPHAPEHAIEVELPFLQSVLGVLPIVPLLFGSTSAAAVAAAIARVWTDDTLLVVSSDLRMSSDTTPHRGHDAEADRSRRSRPWTPRGDRSFRCLRPPRHSWCSERSCATWSRGRAAGVVQFWRRHRRSRKRRGLRSLGLPRAAVRSIKRTADTCVAAATLKG